MAQVVDKMDEAFAAASSEEKELDGKERGLFFGPKLQTMDTVANILRDVDLFESFAGRDAIG